MLRERCSEKSRTDFEILRCLFKLDRLSVIKKNEFVSNYKRANRKIRARNVEEVPQLKLSL